MSSSLNLTDLHEELSAQTILERIGFADWKAALTVIQRIESRNFQGLATIFPFLMSALGSSADPYRSLVNFERFLECCGPGLFMELKENPRVIEILVTLFSASPFLTEILLRTPDALELLENREVLTERKTIDQFQGEAIASVMSAETEDKKLNAIRLYQRRQLLRIGANDILGLYDLRTVFSQLSRLAISLVRASLFLAAQQTGITQSGFVILAMGKLGGWELNYSSDIDLVFIAKNNVDSYVPLAEQLITNIATTTSEGFLYRVDLRLRPWGNDGTLITTLDTYLKYLHDHARLWEKQALLKARPIAGNLSLGEEFLNEVRPYIYLSPPDEVRTGIFYMKQRTEEYLREKGRSWGDVKLGEGSIRDIEFVVQFLQMGNPSIRTRATLKAIPLLGEAGLLELSETRILFDGYKFLRTIEHYLQIIDYRQTYALPSDLAALGLLARKLGFEGPQAGKLFLESYEQHCRAIRSIFLKYVGNEPADKNSYQTEASQQALLHIARMDASYTLTFTKAEIEHHVHLINRLSDVDIVIVDAKPIENSQWRVTVVGYDYPGEISLICGLMFIYGQNIIECQAFTYEPSNGIVPWSDSILPQDDPAGSRPIAVIENRIDRSLESYAPDQKKIVDVFTVRPVFSGVLNSVTWDRYSEDLNALLKKTRAGHRREARGELAKRVGEVFQGKAGKATALYPIDIEIDNNSSSSYTILEIGSTDTVGFLYEFSNALAIYHINISRMFVQSVGSRVRDTIYVTDDRGRKITSTDRQRELRAAIVLIKHFTHLLPRSPNPESALVHFREFLDQLFERPNWTDELVRIEQPEVLDALARLLGMSDFLWDDFLRMQYSNLFPVVRDVNALAIPKVQRAIQIELDELISRSDDWRNALNSFKDREMFRIDMRHILGYTPEIWDFSFELTDLVDVVISEAYKRCFEDLRKQYGKPLLENGDPCPAAIFSLGKCGGRELGFASDIELMMVYGGNGATSGPAIIQTNVFFEEFMRYFVKSIHARQEGIFEIDLQLRPYGKSGSLAVSLESFNRYFAPKGPAWAYERQALVKLRPICGDKALENEISMRRDEYIYSGEPFDVTAMRAMRERQVRHLVAATTFNAKYSPGGLVDVEYLVQGLQITHGARNPSLRLTNIRMAMEALTEAGILSPNDHSRLRKAHTFLCWLIDSLRVVRGNNRDVNIPPYESEEFSFLARRLLYGPDTNRLKEDLARYPNDVQELSLRLLPT